jgi:tetratricopeptide (TPR) repeat protein
LFFSMCLFYNCKHINKKDDLIIKDSSSATLHSIDNELSTDINDDKSNAVLYYKRARVRDLLNNIPAAVKDMETAVKMDSTNAPWQFFMAQLYEKEPLVKAAITSYKKVLDLKPDDKNAMLRLGAIYYYIKNTDESFHYLNLAIGIDKYLAEAYYYRALNFKEMGKPENAIKSLNASVEANPKYFDAYMQLGLLNAEKKNPLAVAYYTNALSVKPGNERALYARGYFYQSIDSNLLAIKDYEELLLNDSINKNALYNLGFNYYTLKEYKKAISFFSKAAKIDSSYKDAYYGIGLSYQGLGKPLEAAKYLKKSEMSKIKTESNPQ